MSEQPRYLIGQRVLINEQEIGKVVRPPEGCGPARFGLWVYSPSRGYECDFAFTSIKPLPNGQL